MGTSSRPGYYRIAAPAVAAPKSAPPSAGFSTLDTAFRLWCLHEALKLLHEPTWSPWVLACGVAVAAAAVAPRQPLVALALTLRLCDTAMLMPFCWDSFYWCFQIDGGLLLLLLCAASADRDAVARSWAEICRLQLSLFYASAAWWKLNTSFLDPRTSCAPMFFLTLLPTLGYTPSPAAALVVRNLAPAATIGGEACIGLLLAAASNRLRRLGMCLALLLRGTFSEPSRNLLSLGSECASRSCSQEPSRNLLGTFSP